MTREEIAAEADSAARQFAADLSAQDTSTGIPKPIEIVISQTETDIEKFGLDFEPTSKADTIPPASGGGGGGGSIITGACCVGTACSIQQETNCTDMGGTWQGAGTPCTPSPCGGCTDIPVSLGPGGFSGCADTCGSASYGPFATDTNCTFTGSVDDDLMVNGIITQAGVFAFNDCSGCTCESSNGNNGAHSVSYTIFLPAGMTLDLQVLNWFTGNCFYHGNINVCPA